MEQREYDLYGVTYYAVELGNGDWVVWHEGRCVPQRLSASEFLDWETINPLERLV